MFYNARYYSPLLSRFVSADTIVPEPGNPQSLNRYMYVLGNPLVYIDPSGHDVMLIGGSGTNVYNDPKQFKEWISRYKSWSDEDWNNFYDEWMDGDASVRSGLMEKHGVHLFNYNMGWGTQWGTPIGADMIQALSDQLAGMEDITVVGYSKGASLIMSYIAQQEANPGGGLSNFYKAVLIKPAFDPKSRFFSGSPAPGGPFERHLTHAHHFVHTYNGPVKLVNIYSNFDMVTGAGPIAGAFNITDNSSQGYAPTFHGNASDKAFKAYVALDIAGDRNAGIGWSRR